MNSNEDPSKLDLRSLDGETVIIWDDDLDVKAELDALPPDERKAALEQLTDAISPQDPKA